MSSETVSPEYRSHLLFSGMQPSPSNHPFRNSLVFASDSSKMNCGIFLCPLFSHGQKVSLRKRARIGERRKTVVQLSSLVSSFAFKWRCLCSISFTLRIIARSLAFRCHRMKALDFLPIHALPSAKNNPNRDRKSVV